MLSLVGSLGPGLLLATSLTAGHVQGSSNGPPLLQVAVVCMKSGEQTSGMNKICYYNCLGSQVAITIGAVELCPLTIDR